MSLFAWIGWRLAKRPPTPPSGVIWAAILLSALLFAVGHLPLLSLLMPDAPTEVVVAVIVGNALPGIAFGWLFWRRGLEAAMIAHALAHLLSHPFV